jgi:ATP-dependent Clp protease ATP-binding subunit ClpA
MYERFSDNARAAMSLAVSECRRLNDPHRADFKIVADTEYILLGLSLVTDSTAVQVLGQLGVDPDRLRFALNAYLDTHPHEIDVNAWQGNEDVKTTVVKAMEECRGMNQNCVRSEHLLTGLMTTAGGGFQVLSQMGLTLADVREVVRLFNRGSVTD